MSVVEGPDLLDLVHEYADAIGHEAVDGGLAEEFYVAFHQVNPLLGVGVALLREEPEQ